MILNPIVDWKDNDVWDYIHLTNYRTPSYNDQGHDRIGCILCPLKCFHKRIRDYYEYPAHVRALERAIGIFSLTRPESGLWNWGKTPKEIIMSWVTSTPGPMKADSVNLLLEVNVE